MERVDDILVMDDFMAYVDGRTIALDGELDDVYGPYNACAKSSRSTEYDFHNKGMIPARCITLTVLAWLLY